MPKSTLTLVNTLTSIRSFAYSNHIALFLKMKEQYPEDAFHLLTPNRMSIDNARTWAINIAIENKLDYVFYLDDDVLVPPDAYQKLRDANKDVISGVTYVRGKPFPMMAFRAPAGDPEGLDFAELDTTIDAPQKVKALGFSCCLIKTKVFKEIPEPWIVTLPNEKNRPGATEDVFFCLKAKQYRPKTSIFVHTGVHTSHILEPEVVHPSNVAHLRKFYSVGKGFPNIEHKT